MACFLVSVAEAAVVTVVEKVQEKKESKMMGNDTSESAASAEQTAKIPLSRKLKWLRYMLLGGSVLLLFEHIWHGEIVPWFPFLTAMDNSADMMEMFKEMATVGVAMAGLITFVWIVMCKVADAIVRRPSEESSKEMA